MTDLQILVNQASPVLSLTGTTSTLLLDGQTTIAATTGSFLSTGAGATLTIIAKDSTNIANTGSIVTSDPTGLTQINLWDESQLGTTAFTFEPGDTVTSHEDSVLTLSTNYAAIINPALGVTFQISLAGGSPNDFSILGVTGNYLLDVDTGHVWSSINGSVWSGVETNVTFMPGGVNASNVFTDFTQITDYVEFITAPVQINVDLVLTAGTFNLPAGDFPISGSMSFRAVSLDGSATNATLVFSAGTTFDEVPEQISGFLTFQVTQVGVDVVTLSANTTNFSLRDSASIFSSGAGAGAFVAITGGTINLFLYDSSSLAASDAFTINPSGAGTATIIVFDGVSIAPGATTTNPAFASIFIESGAVFVDASYAPNVVVASGVCWSAAIPDPNGVVTADDPGSMFANTGGGVGTTLWVARTGGDTGWFNLA
jgi:hypothetical protein